jgi:hypothetical protein
MPGTGQAPREQTNGSTTVFAVLRHTPVPQVMSVPLEVRSTTTGSPRSTQSLDQVR